MRSLLFSVTLILGNSLAYADIGLCPVSADFISKPEIIENTMTFGGIQIRSITKRSFVKGAMLSIECTEINPNDIFPGASDEEILRNYLRFWSIKPLDDPSGGRSQGQSPVPHLIMTGTKMIQGIEVTFSYRLFRFPHSSAMVAIGGPTDTLDDSDISRFLDSINIQIAEQELTDAEKYEGRKGHLAACLPAMIADNKRRQLGLSELEIAFYCSCTGTRYFDEFSRAELQILTLGKDSVLKARREQIQTECFEEATK